MDFNSKILPGVKYFLTLDSAGAARSFDSSPNHGLDINENDTKAGIVAAQLILQG